MYNQRQEIIQVKIISPELNWKAEYQWVLVREGQLQDIDCNYQEWLHLEMVPISLKKLKSVIDKTSTPNSNNQVYELN